jgi:hypothetical protein
MQASFLPGILGMCAILLMLCNTRSLCPEGMYQASINATTCSRCPGNTSTTSPGATGLSACKCARGFESTSLAGLPGTEPQAGVEQRCVACTPGKAAAAVGGTCEGCAPGSYNNVSASSACVLCGRGEGETVGDAGVRGRFQPAGGQTKCLDCPSSLHRSDPGALGREQCRCKRGYEGPDGAHNTSAGDAVGSVSVPNWWTFADMCMPCRPGYFKPSTTQGAFCLPCPPGSYASAAGMTTCTMVSLVFFFPGTVFAAFFAADQRIRASKLVACTAAAGRRSSSSLYAPQRMSASVWCSRQCPPSTSSAAAAHNLSLCTCNVGYGEWIDP